MMSLLGCLAITEGYIVAYLAPPIHRKLHYLIAGDQIEMTKPIKQLQKMLDDIAAYPHDPAHEREAMQEFYSQGSMSALIEYISLAPEDFVRAGGLSYRHPNGFDKHILASSFNNHYIARLHIWWADCESKDTGVEDIHDHAWDFASLVLVGSLEVQIFEQFSSQHKTHSHYRCSITSRDLNPKLEFKGLKSLREIYSACVVSGSNYFLDHRVLHRVHTNVTTATLMLQRPFVRNYSNVYDDRTQHHRSTDIPISWLTPQEIGLRMYKLGALLS